MPSHYQKAYFLLSAAETKQLPPDDGIEVAIVGRSNAGKSSVLNKLTHSKALARVSKTPGRTQLLNIFVLDERRRLVDLPGYGYAAAPTAAKQKWQKSIDHYMRTRMCLQGVILVTDIRHPLKPLDRQLLEYCKHCKKKVHILLNKMDKLSKGAAANIINQIKAEFAGEDITIQGFSALKGTGINELHALLDNWYDYE